MPLPDTRWQIVREGVLALPTTQFEIVFVPQQTVSFHVYHAGRLVNGYGTLEAAKLGAAVRMRELIDMGMTP